MKRRTKHKVEDLVAILVGGLLVALLLALIPFGIWLHFMAPCKYVTWMPVREIPARCLDITRP